MHRLTRTELLKSSARFAGAATLAGTGGGMLARAAGAERATASRASESLEGTVTVWIHQSAAYQSIYNSLVKKFEKINPGVTIKTLAIPYAQFENKALIAFTSGSPPDIIKLGAWDIANYASKDLLAEADPHALGYRSHAALEKAYAPGALGALTYERKLYGLPIDYNSLFFFYRRDHFEKAGLDPDKPPKTWEQVASYAKKLTVKNSKGHLERAGFNYWYNLPIWDFLNFLPLPVGLGGRLVDSKNQGMLSTPQGIKALTWYSDLSNTLEVASPKLTNPNFNYGQIADGSASMTVSANFAISLIESLGKIKLGKEFDVAPMPQWAHAKRRVTSGYSWAWLVARKSSNQKAAWAFLRFLQSPENVNAQLKVSNLIIPIKGWQHGKVAAHSKGTQIVSNEIAYTDYGPTLPQWSQMAQQLSDNLTALALGQKSPKQAASDWDNAMKRIA